MRTLTSIHGCGTNLAHMAHTYTAIEGPPGVFPDDSFIKWQLSTEHPSYSHRAFNVICPPRGRRLKVELSREAEGRRLYGDSNSCARGDRTPATGMAGLLSRPAPSTSSEKCRCRVFWETVRRSVSCWTNRAWSRPRLMLSQLLQSKQQNGAHGECAPPSRRLLDALSRDEDA
jgi:hypothetical protein